MSPAPRLLVLTPDFPPAVGGIQRLLGRVCAHLAAEYEITVVTPKEDGASGDGGAAVEVIGTRAAWGGRATPAVIAEMAARAARSRADLILVGHLACLPAAAVAARTAPIVLWAYGSELWSPRGRMVLRWFGHRIDRALAISEFTAAQLRAQGLPGERISVCPPGIEPDAAPDPDVTRAVLTGLDLWHDGAPAPYVVCVARLSEPHKGHELLLRTWPAVSARHRGARCVIVGSGPLEHRFRVIADQADADAPVIFTGRVAETDKHALLAGARALVMASTIEPAAAQFEGFGLTYLEAALFGRPSIAADCAAPPEVVRDGETGFLVTPGDGVSLFVAIDRVLQDPALADRLGSAARERVHRCGLWASRMPAIRAALHEART